MIVTHIEGLQAMVAGLEGVAQGAKNKLARKAADAGGQIILAAIKAGTPSASGLATKSLGKKVVTYSNVAVAVVGPRVGFRKDVQLTLHAKGRVRSAIAGTKRAQRNATRADKVVTRIYDPVKYFHLIEGGRKAVGPTEKKVLSSGLVIYGKESPAVAGKHPLEHAQAQTAAQVQEAARKVFQDGIEALAKG